MADALQQFDPRYDDLAVEVPPPEQILKPRNLAIAPPSKPPNGPHDTGASRLHQSQERFYAQLDAMPIAA